MKRGDVVEFKGDAGPGLQGNLGVIVRRSKRTAVLTVELVQDAGAYKKGDTVHVQAYQVQKPVVVR